MARAGLGPRGFGKAARGYANGPARLAAPISTTSTAPAARASSVGSALCRATARAAFRASTDGQATNPPHDLDTQASMEED